MTSPSRALQVLVVDPDPRVRSGLVELIGSGGDLAVAAASGDAASAVSLAARAGLPVDVALVAVELGRDDAAALGLVRALAANLPVVALSIGGAARAAALAAGACGYLEKGGSPDQLLAELHRAAAQGPVPHHPEPSDRATGQQPVRPARPHLSPSRPAPRSTR